MPLATPWDPLTALPLLPPCKPETLAADVASLCQELPPSSPQLPHPSGPPLQTSTRPAESPRVQWRAQRNRRKMTPSKHAVKLKTSVSSRTLDADSQHNQRVTLLHLGSASTPSCLSCHPLTCADCSRGTHPSNQQPTGTGSTISSPAKTTDLCAEKVCDIGG